jgi:hypothetical protein
MFKQALIVVVFLTAVFAFAFFLMLGGPQAKRILEWVRGFVMGGHLARLAAAAGVVGVLLIVFTVTTRTRRARGIWEGFAARSGLACEKPTHFLDTLGRVHGLRSGRRVKMEPLTWSDLRDDAKQVLQLHVEVPGMVPGLRVTRRVELPQPMRVVQEALSERWGGSGEVRTGDEGFDRAFSVTCAEGRAAQDWLDTDRRHALKVLLAEPGFLVVEGGLAYSRSRSPESIEELTRVLDRLERAAEALETPGS